MFVDKHLQPSLILAVEAESLPCYHDTQPNDIQHNDTQHNDIQHRWIICVIQHNDTQHIDIQHNKTLPIC